MSTDNTEELGEQNESGGEELNEGFNNTEGGEENLVIAEPRQPVNRSTVVMFAILVIGAAGLYFMYRQAGPRLAGAAVTQETADAKKTISTFLQTGETGFKSMEARLKNTEKVVQQFKTYPSATQVPLGDLQTNPFREHAEEAKNTNNDALLSEAAEKKKREEQRIAIRKAVDGLQVQSIMCSDTRKACMINNTLYREGQSIDDFTVEKISPATVLVKNGIYRFELRMAR
jgi:hypothetical protein